MKTYLYFTLLSPWAGRTQIGFHCDGRMRNHILTFFNKKEYHSLIEGGENGIVEQEAKADGYTIVTWLDFSGFAERELDRKTEG